MDDFNVSSLHESKNEWGARLLTILTPLVIEGLRIIFDDACKACRQNREMDKYMMTFQNMIARIPKWNPHLVETERKRIVERSGCSYLEDLVTCIHIIQLKLLTAMRVGNKPRKIDIRIPKLDDFLHKVYVHVARKVYKNVYLFELNATPLQVQKNNRELELIVQECILNAVRESIPVENILRAYMDETVEEDVVEEVHEQVVEAPPKSRDTATATAKESEGPGSISKEPGKEQTSDPGSVAGTGGGGGGGGLTFNDVDSVLSHTGAEEQVPAPKTIERLEEISVMRNLQRKMEEAAEGDEDDDGALVISDEPVQLNIGDIPSVDDDAPIVLEDIEVLE